MKCSKYVGNVGFSFTYTVCSTLGVFCDICTTIEFYVEVLYLVHRTFLQVIVLGTSWLLHGTLM